MRTSPLDLLVRIVSMVLAGLVSLSLLGAIHTATQGVGPADAPGGFRVRSDPPAPAPPAEEQGLRRAAGDEAEGEGKADGVAPGAGEGTGAGAGEAVSVPPEPPTPAERSARWLEVIAYLLFALTGIAALIALGLWRGVRELGRSADAAEMLAAREPTR